MSALRVALVVLTLWPALARAGAVLSPSPSPLALGGTPLNTPLNGNFTVTNTGDASVSVTAVSVTTDAASFGATPSVGLPVTLAPNDSFTVGVSFQSSSPGTHTGTITIVATGIADTSETVTASTGPPMVQLNSGTILFANQHIGTTSTALTLFIANAGFSDLTVTSISPTGAQATDFVVTATLPMVIHAGSQRSYGLAFAPMATGMRQASVAVSSDDPANPNVSFTASGTGVAFSESVSPASLSFSPQAAGTAVAKPVTVSNTSSAPLNITSLAIVSSSGGFALQSPPATPFAVAANGSSMIDVVFAASMSGTYSGTLQIGTDDPAHPILSVPLTGTVIAPRIMLTPASLDFGAVASGTSSTGQPVTIANAGDDTLHISAITVGGAQADWFSITDLPALPADVAAGGQLLIHVVFSPASLSAATGEVDFASNDPATPTAVVTLSGQGASAPDLGASADLATPPDLAAGDLASPDDLATTPADLGGSGPGGGCAMSASAPAGTGLLAILLLAGAWLGRRRRR